MADQRGIDIHSLLKAGSFQTSRSKSPKPSKMRAERPSQHYSAPTERIELHSAAVESSSAQRRANRDRGPARTPRRPPQPTVEDEAENPDGEYADEEAKSRGDVDQYPIIIDMHEYLQNKEQRFVLVKDSDDAASTADEASAAGGVSDEYTANTGRKYKAEPQKRTNLPTPKSSGLERKRSHKDLPRLSTKFESSGRSGRPSASAHRSRSRAKVDDPRSSQPDFASPRNDPRKSTDGLLSPKIIKQGTRNREETYYNYGRGYNGSATGDRRGHSADKRLDDPRASYTSIPSVGKRPDLEYEKHRRRFSKDRERSYSQERSYSRERSNSKERSSESPRRRPAGERGLSSSPPKQRERKSPSPPARRSDRGKLSRRSSSYKTRESPPRERPVYSTDEDVDPRRRVSSYRRRKSIIMQEDRNGIPSPEGPRPPGEAHSRSRSKASATSSMASLQGPRSSATFPIRPAESKPSAPYPDEEGPPSLASRRSVRETRSKSREPTTMPIPVPIPIPVPAGPRDQVDRRRSGIPNPSDGRSYIPTPSKPTPSSWQSSSPPRQSSWQPAPFNPETSYLKPDKTVGSFRRHSEDADRGGYPMFPECSRADGVAGLSDWMTLARCDNFNICPDCYNAVFYNSKYRSQFMPMPWRPRDKKIVCDFGGISPWYRIAYLLTLKNRVPDLRLFKEVDSVTTDVAAMSQECSGSCRAARIWYSIRNPTTGRTIPDFNVCYECVKTVEALLPNLRGLFMRLDSSAEPTKAVCALQNETGRKRFVRYVDALEIASDAALSNGTSPNIPALAAEIESLARLAECCEDKPVANARWFFMDDLPEFTVCEGCFNDVIAPRLSGAEPGSIPRLFYPKRLASQQTCQLYSNRMRDIFHRACRADDLKMLEEAVLERRNVETSVRSKLSRLDRVSPRDSRTDQAMEDLIQHWKTWE